ncbi:hypothetical protein [Azotosporobacter soli]|uniref:hypothetical protein n=1 Tax=Azotosporobacter soli TaxID=3055040 RepID=UPI0031FF3F7B
MWKKHRVVQCIVAIIFVISFAIPAFQVLGDLLINPSVYQDRKANMKQEYANINPPPNAKKINETVSSKITRIWISTDYSVEMGKEDMEKYYQEELKEKGWKFDKVDNAGSLLFVKKECIFVITSLDYNKVHTSMHYKGDGPNI